MAITQVSNSLVKQDLTISGGTVDNTVIGSGTPAAGTFTTVAGALASTVTGTTAAASDNSTKIATTAYVTTALANLVDSAPGTLNTLNELAAALGDDASFSTTVTTSIAAKLPLAGGTMTGLLTAAAKLKITDVGNATVAALQLTDAGLGISSPSADQMNFITADTTRMVIDSSGRVGVGGTPNSGWRNDATDRVLTLGTEAAVHSDAGVTTELWNNAYVNNSDQFLNISTRGASRYLQYSGAHKWFTAASASAGSTISTEINSSPKMVLDVSGNLGIGVAPTFTPGGSRKLLQVTNAANGGQISMGNNSSESENPRIFSDADNLGFATATTGGGFFQFYTGGSERLRIDSAGDARFAANSTGAALIKGVSGDQTNRNAGGYPQFTFVGNEGTGIRRPSANVLAFDTSGDEAMRINSAGDWMVSNTVANVASNYSAQGGCGWVESDNHFEIATTSNRSVLEIGKNNANDGAIINFRKQSTTVGSIGSYSGVVSYLVLDPRANGSGLIGLTNEIAPTNESGNPSDAGKNLGSSSRRFKDLYLSGGVYLGGTGSANHLDDYEEGNWTPTIQSTGTFNAAGASYTKVGRMVTAHCAISSISNTTSTNTFAISLPFSAAAADRSTTLGFIGAHVNLEVTGGYIASGSVLYLYSHGSNSSYRPLKHSDFSASPASQFYIAFTYMAA